MATPPNKTTTAIGVKPPAVTIGVGVGVGVGTGLAAAEQTEVTSEVTSEATETAPARRFVTTTEDAPPAMRPASGRRLNAKTLAEQAAGRERIAAYYPVGE